MISELVLIGGGHSHAIALKLFAENPLQDVRLTLISDVEKTPYSGMLPGYIAGFYSYDECHIDLRAIAQSSQTQLIIDRAIWLDLKNNTVICENHLPVKFDFLSIDIGSTPATISVPGASESAIPIKPVSKFLRKWNQLIEAVTNQPQTPICLGIVGGGAGGVELALNMQTRLHQIFKNAAQPLVNLTIHLFNREPELMPSHNKWVRHHIQKLLINRGIQLHLQENVYTVEQDLIKCESGLTVECNYIFWVTQASAPNWLKISELDSDAQGFILVNEFLQSVSHPNIFAAGDIATIVNHPCPKSGVFAVRQGKPLFKNLQQTLLGQPLQPYKPQKRYLSLIGTGNKSAVASWGSFGWESPLLWFWKDWLDRGFMKQFNNL